MEQLQEKLNESLVERDLLEDQVKSMREDLENFRCQTKIVSNSTKRDSNSNQTFILCKQTSTCAIVPLIMLLIAILIAFYPTVSSVTGTID